MKTQSKYVNYVIELFSVFFNSKSYCSIVGKAELLHFSPVIYIKAQELLANRIFLTDFDHNDGISPIS